METLDVLYWEICGGVSLALRNISTTPSLYKTRNIVLYERQQIIHKDEDALVFFKHYHTWRWNQNTHWKLMYLHVKFHKIDFLYARLSNLNVIKIHWQEVNVMSLISCTTIFLECTYSLANCKTRWRRRNTACSALNFFILPSCRYTFYSERE